MPEAEIDPIRALANAAEALRQHGVPFALIDVPGAGLIPVARAEELVALKLLSVKPQRPLDQVDLESLIAINPSLDSLLREVGRAV